MSTLAGIALALATALHSPAFASAPGETREAFAAGVGSAVAEATCSEAWSGAVDCQPLWPASRARELVATVVTLAWYEAGLSPRIGAGQCRPNECDAVKLPGGRVQHLALGYWQLHRTGLMSPDEWREAHGAGAWSVHVQASIAIRVLAAARGACRGSGAPELRAAISGYATGGRCWWSGAAARERTVLRVLAMR